jgi:hypothetical protein
MPLDTCSGPWISALLGFGDAGAELVHTTLHKEAWIARQLGKYTLDGNMASVLYHL